MLPVALRSDAESIVTSPAANLRISLVLRSSTGPLRVEER